MYYVTLALILVCVALWVRWRRKKLSFWQEHGIPGPTPNFWIGNLYEFYSLSPLVAHKKWIEKYGRVFGYYFGLRPVLIVEDPEYIKNIQVKNFHIFANRPVVFDFRNRPPKPEDQSLISNRGEKWKLVRSILSPSFTINKMKLMAPIMNEAIDELMDNLKQKGPEEFDIYELYKRLTMDVIGRAAFGIQTRVQKDPENDLFLKCAKILFHSSPFSRIFLAIAVSLPEVRWLCEKARLLELRLRYRGPNPLEALRQACTEVIERRKKDPKARRTDLLQLMLDSRMTEHEVHQTSHNQLIAGENDEGLPANQDGVTSGETGSTKTNLSTESMLTKKETIQNAMVFFLAGYETTSTALAFLTYLLAKYPEKQEKVREELQDIVKKEGELNYTSVQKLQYLDQFFMEGLRVHPPVYLFVNRESSEEFKCGSVVIPKGVAVQVPTYVLHHDPEYWPDPDLFDPDRFSPENRRNSHTYAIQTFGAGPRNCIGMRFAQMEVKMALSRILLKYRILPGKSIEKGDLKVRLSNAIRRPEAVPVHLEPIA